MAYAPKDGLSALVLRVKRRPATFVAVFAIALVAVMGLDFLLLPQYTANTSVVIETDPSPANRPPDAATASDAIPADPAEVESQVAVIEAPRMIHAILAKSDVHDALARACAFDLKTSHFIYLVDWVENLFGGAGDPCSTDGLFDTVHRNLSVSEVGRSRVIAVSFESSLPDTAEITANALVSEYLADNMAARSKASLDTAKWLEQEAAAMRADLVKKEAQIQQYQSTHDLLHGQVALVTQESLSSLVTQLAQAKTKVAEATARLNEVQDAVKHGRSLGSMPEVVSSGTIRELRDHEAVVEGRLAELSSQYGPRYPAVIDAKSQLNGLRASLEAETNRIIASLQSDVRNAQLGEQSLQAALDRTKTDAAAADTANSAGQSLVLDADIERQLYLKLSSNAMAMESEVRAEAPSARLVSAADLPQRASFPDTIHFGAAGIVLASVLGMGAAFWRDYSDRTLRSADDITGFGVPILSKIPVDRRIPYRGAVKAAGGVSPFHDSIRALFAHVQLKREEDLRTILVTSSAPQEGKTTVAMSLAHIAATAGHRVLLIEADMRMPSLGRSLALRSQRGLEHYLRANERDTELDIETPFPGLPNFQVLPAGRVTQHSTELLGGSRMRDVLRTCREAYDLTIIDSPPCGYLMDACVLARLTDGVVYVARWGHIDPAVVQDGMRAIKDAGGNIIGAVLGMVETRRYGMYNASGPTIAKTYLASSNAG